MVYRAAPRFNSCVSLTVVPHAATILVVLRVQKKVKSESDIASSYIEAARAYVKAGDSKLATDLLENEALPRMVDAGRLSQAAKLHQEVAEMFEEEGNYAPAIDNFQKAADLFNADNSASTASKCISKVAHLAAQVRPTASILDPSCVRRRLLAAALIASLTVLLFVTYRSLQLDPPDYALSAEMFEKCGADSLSSNLLKFSAKGYFTNAVLAQLARDDVVTAELALGKYKDMDYTFPGSRECKLLDDLVQAVKDGNVEAFTDAIYNYDQISKLDPWKTSLLLKVKNNMSKGMGGASGGAGGEPDLT